MVISHAEPAIHDSRNVAFEQDCSPRPSSASRRRLPKNTSITTISRTAINDSMPDRAAPPRSGSPPITASILRRTTDSRTPTFATLEPAGIPPPLSPLRLSDNGSASTPRRHPRRHACRSQGRRPDISDPDKKKLRKYSGLPYTQTMCLLANEAKKRARASLKARGRTLS